LRFVSYSLRETDQPRFGYIENGYVIDILRAAIWAKETQSNNDFLSIPTSLKTTLEDWSLNLSRLKELSSLIPRSIIPTIYGGGKTGSFPVEDVILHPPVYDPPSFRDFYAFEQHVKTARKFRGQEVPEIWYKIPVFYFSNHNSLLGHKAVIPYPHGTSEMDFELELGIIIAEGGRNIDRAEADKYIAGFTIINDWSARDIQREEMQLNLGPAKGKDFATSVGPVMVTPDELEQFKSDGKLNLTMSATINGKQVSEGNTSDLYHSFGAMIERASNNVFLKAGDLIGSGTVGTGCILELRPENTGGWLKSGDMVKLTIEAIGTLENRIK